MFVCRGVWWGRWQGPGVVWKAKSEIVSAYVGVLLAVSLCMCMCVQARSPPCKSESDSSSSGLANSYQHPFCGGCCSLVACIHAQTLAYTQVRTNKHTHRRRASLQVCASLFLLRFAFACFLLRLFWFSPGSFEMYSYCGWRALEKSSVKCKNGLKVKRNYASRETTTMSVFMTQTRGPTSDPDLHSIHLSL